MRRRQKKNQNQSKHGKKQKRYNCTKPTWDPDIDWVLWFWLWISMNPLWNLKIWSNCCIFGWRQLLTWQLLNCNTDWCTGLSIWRSRCFLEIYNIDHIELKKKKNSFNVIWKWGEEKGLKKERQHGSHWSILLTRLFLSCCIDSQQENHTRHGEGGYRDRNNKDYCSSD